jgi:hypothetical protein
MQQEFWNLEPICNRSFGLRIHILVLAFPTNLQQSPVYCTKTSVRLKLGKRKKFYMHSESNIKVGKRFFYWQIMQQWSLYRLHGESMPSNYNHHFSFHIPFHLQRTYSKQQFQRILDHLLKLANPLASHSTIHNLMIKTSRNNDLIVPFYRCPFF